MGNTTKPVLFYDGNGFFFINGRTRTPVDRTQAVSLKPGYDLVFDDSLLFYTFMEFPHASKRKILLFIRNWLSRSFPAEYSDSFGYLKKGDGLLISLFRNETLQDADIKKISEKAGRIASPLSIKYGLSDSFKYRYKNTALKIEDGRISHIPADFEAEEKRYDVSDSSALTLNFINRQSFGLDAYKTPAVVILVCYILFFAGSYMRLSYHKERRASAEAMLSDVYRMAGVADRPDPFGQLMFLAGKNSGGESFRSLRIIEALSRAQSERITAVSLEIKNGSVVYEGTADDYAYIEDFKKQLKRELNKDVTVSDTRKTDAGINFRMRF